ncbi:hypothetical protein ABZX75_05315 [Streptomyces sp. NPDC003038]|uniref:hypothetical protein n=1 Tax=unclassified Streptomyces TaxID=2593676 RepID=UPI0033B1F2C8
MWRRWKAVVMVARAGTVEKSAVAAHANESAREGRTARWRVEPNAPAAGQANVARTGAGVTPARSDPAARGPAGPPGHLTGNATGGVTTRC